MLSLYLYCILRYFEFCFFFLRSGASNGLLKKDDAPVAPVKVATISLRLGPFSSPHPQPTRLGKMRSHSSPVACSSEPEVLGALL